MNKIEYLLKQAFDPYFAAPIEIWKTFADKGFVEEVRKGQVVKDSHTIERNLSFILKGSGGILLLKNASPVCIDLCYEHDFFGDYMSFLTQRASPLEVLVFEDTTLFRIPYTKFLELAQTEFGLQLCKIAAESLFIHKQKQQIDLMLLTAEERYLDLMERQPHALQRTPLKYIASYLGIIPESLSRIRKNIAR